MQNTKEVPRTVVPVVGSEMPVQFIGTVNKPQQDSVQATLDLIRQEADKVRYSDEDKWLMLTGPEAILKAVVRKMRQEHRLKYGTQGRHWYQPVVQFEQEGWVLYVRAD